MTELIAKLEAVPSGSKELDADVADAVGVMSRSRRTASGKSKGREWFVDAHGSVQTWAQDPPGFTQSLDAALTLVPEEYWWGIQHSLGGQGTGKEIYHATVHTWVSDTSYKFWGISMVPAIAFTIAALKARAH